MFIVTEVKSNECPVSITHNDPAAKLLVQQYVRTRSLQKIGVTPDQRSLPIPLADAFVVLSGEEELARGAVAERDALEDKFSHDSFPGR